MNFEFNSSYKEDMYTYMEFRVSTMSWNTYRVDAYHLMSLDRYLDNLKYDEEVVTENVINRWLLSEAIPAASIAGYIKTVRGFMKFRRNLGKKIYLPPMRKTTDLYIPYIFTDNELKEIITCLDSLSKFITNSVLPYICVEIPMIIRLLYCCGLRLNETLQIKSGDINHHDGIIRILHAKGKKQRIVPVHPSLKDMLLKYCMSLGIIASPEAYLFPSKTFDKHISASTVERKFKIILRHLGIVSGHENPHKRGPCLHCLRHCFILKSFKQLKAKGYEFNISAPYLSVYCGHNSLRESEKYMKFSSEMFEEDMKRFEAFSKNLFPEVLL